MKRPTELSAEHKRDWEELADFDACWAILSDPDKKFGGWEIDEFLESGRVEVAAAMRQAEQLGYPEHRRSALDFGCGYGRLTRALSEYFESCVGVDVSGEMVAGAERINADAPTCRFVVNDRADLNSFSDSEFDMVFTKIVLQHVPDRDVIRNYISEFVRILKPGGLAVFQLPSFIPLKHRLQPVARAYRLLRKLGVSSDVLFTKLHLQPMRMSYLPENEVSALLAEHGSHLLKIETERQPTGSVSSTYFATH